jgi:hypothetical protein
MKIDRCFSTGAIALGLLPLLLGGCFVLSDDADDAPAWSSWQDAGVAQVDHDAAVAEEFNLEFTGLVRQSVRWASVDVSVTGARQTRAAPVDAQGSDWFFYPIAPPIYVELDLQLENKGARETALNWRDTWDLLLSDGTRLRPDDGFTVRILPGDTATASLHYQVEDVVALEGAKLILEGEARATLEPQPLPLDALNVQEFPRRIPQLVGQTLHTDDGDVIQIDEAAYDVNFLRASRARRGKRFVWLRVAVTAAARGYLDTGDFRVVVDGRASAPEERDFLLIDAMSTEVASVGFEIDASVTHFELTIPTSNYAVARFPVDVGDTVLASDL